MKKKNFIKIAKDTINLEIKALNKLKNNSVSAILEGKIIDKNQKVALNYGEIIKTNTLKILTKKFSIHTKLLVLNVS